MKIFTVALICLAALGARAGELRSIEWKQISNDEGISVFQPVNYQHESGLVPIRFKATLHHDVARVLSVLADNERKVEWLPRAIEIKVLEKKSVKELTVYYRYDFPWPFNDREFVMYTRGKWNPETRTINVDLKSIEHKDAPRVEGRVRGISYDGYSIIKSIGPGETSVEMAFLNDLGGLMPNFIINGVQKKWPYRFMKLLREQLNRDDIKINPEFSATSQKK